MKVSEYIDSLQKLMDKHGDIEVWQYRNGRIFVSNKPGAKHLRILSKRESVQDTWEEWRSTCTPENKGEKIISL